MATAHLVVSAMVRRDGRVLLVREIGPGDPEPCWMLRGEAPSGSVYRMADR
jgi:hypothetical protein